MVACLGYMPPTRMHCTARGGGRWELARGSAHSSRRALAGDDGEQRARAGLKTEARPRPWLVDPIRAAGTLRHTALGRQCHIPQKG